MNTTWALLQARCSNKLSDLDVYTKLQHLVEVTPKAVSIQPLLELQLTPEYLMELQYHIAELLPEDSPDRNELMLTFCSFKMASALYGRYGGFNNYLSLFCDTSQDTIAIINSGILIEQLLNQYPEIVYEPFMRGAEKKVLH